MLKSIIPIFAVMCVAVAIPTQSHASVFARIGATAAIRQGRSFPCDCLWASYCAESKPICQRCRPQRRACGCGPRRGSACCKSACCKSACAQKQPGCDVGCNTCRQRNLAPIVRSRRSTSAPQYIEPWPIDQDPFDFSEHPSGEQPARIVLPPDRGIPQDFVPPAPRIVLPR